VSLVVSRGPMHSFCMQHQVTCLRLLTISAHQTARDRSASDLSHRPTPSLAGFLMQMDKLIQLLESPIFVLLRLQLLQQEAPSHPDLLKSLYGANPPAISLVNLN
jgi:hypothetical protein